jgi:hypothetical protein
MLWYTLPSEYSGTGVISANSLSKYVSVQFGIADDVPIDIDNEHCTIYEREYNGIEYTIHETNESTMANIILFAKEDYYFILREPFAMGIEELYETAKNTVAVPFTDKELYESENSINERFAKIQERKFEFTYLPEGVELRDTEVLGDNAGTVGIFCFDAEKGFDAITLMYNKADNLGLNLTYEAYEDGIKTQVVDGICYFCGTIDTTEKGWQNTIAWADSTYEFVLKYDDSISFEEIVKVAQSLKETK